MTARPDASFAFSCRERSRSTCCVAAIERRSAASGKTRCPACSKGRVPDASPYLLRIQWPAAVQETEDPYSFGPLLGELDLHLFNEGRHFKLAEALGANLVTVDGVQGVRFAVWAPNAQRVAVIGDFNVLGCAAPSHAPAFSVGHLGGLRAAPGGGRALQVRHRRRRRRCACRPRPTRWPSRPSPRPPRPRSSPSPFAWRWSDQRWMAGRAERQSAAAPISIYEMHVGSWMRPADGERGSLWDLATERLIPYLADLGFTHVELLPITEHPFGGSWGYQPLGLFAPSARFGPPEAFARFVDALHAADIGVILDWVPAHFPTDPHGLARFDGTALYEHLDPREGFHRDWNTYIYNFGRHEVQGFLIASALHWLEHFHVDGLRVDAVASMLYRDYSRPAGDWIPNIHGGRENLEAIDFLRHLNAVVARTLPRRHRDRRGIDGLARRDRAAARAGSASPSNGTWAGCTTRCATWSTIRSIAPTITTTSPSACSTPSRSNSSCRSRTTRWCTAKARCSARCRATAGRRFANLRAYLGFMWAHPGKKLLFMGGEIAQEREWNHDGELDWPCSTIPTHAGIQRLVRDLNRLYRREPALHRRDAAAAGFRWLIGDDRANSVFAFLRLGEDGQRACPGRLQHDAGAAPRLSHRRAAAPAAGARSPTPIRASTAAATSAMTARSTTLEQPSHGEPQSVAAHPAATRHHHAARRGLTMVSWPDRLLPGTPYPLGATWDGLGTNFAVFSANATKHRALPVRSVRPARDRSASRCRNAPTRSGTAICPTRAPGLIYGYRAHGPYEPQHGHRFNPHKLLLDPYARRLAGELRCVRRAVRLSRELAARRPLLRPPRQRARHAQGAW